MCLGKDDSVRIKSNEERTAQTRSLLLFDKAIFICKFKSTNYYYKETILINELRVDLPTRQNSSSTTNHDSVTSISLSGINHNQYFLTLTNTMDKSRYFHLYFKNDKQRSEWKVLILNAIDKIQPNGFNSNNHLFVLSNYERDFVHCSFCKKILYGVFYQGYKCEKCSHVAHKQCISKFGACTVQISGSLKPIPNQPPRTQRMLSTTSLKNVQYKVKALYSYNGRPIPPYSAESCGVLRFNVNDLIVVTDDDDDEWWKGYKCGTVNSTEGYFPKSYISFDISESPGVAPSMDLIENRAWYAKVDREKADLILNRIQIQPLQAIFLVRPRQEGDFAISIKYEKVEHIKIHTLKNADNTTSVCLVEQKQFSSVIDLVLFYMEHTLEENFPQLRTNLGKY